MAEVVLFVDDFGLDPAVRHCRICHEEESESFNSLEAPCACSGTVKFAHRDCIQRWCNEKGNTTCEICLQGFEPGYTAPSKKKPPPMETRVTIRDSLQVPRRQVELHNEGLRDDNQLYRFISPSENGVSRLRSFALIVTLVLLVKHSFDVVMGGARDYPFSLITVKYLSFLIFMLGASGIIIPMYIMVRTITALQNGIKRQQYHVSHGVEAYYTSNTDELDENEVAQRRHHTL